MLSLPIAKPQPPAPPPAPRAGHSWTAGRGLLQPSWPQPFGGGFWGPPSPCISSPWEPPLGLTLLVMRPSLLLVSCLNCHLSFTPKLPGEDWAKMNRIMTRQETEAWRTSLACAGSHRSWGK